MADGTIPIGTIPPQVLTTTFIGNATALVDDPVALVDDPNVLVGSQTTAIANMKTHASTNAPKGGVQQRR
jgi:hypothetical protein